MLSICKEILDVIREYYGDYVFLILAAISYIYLFVKDKELRRKWLYPIALIMFCIVNPVLYKYIFQNIIYWRLFWMFPDAIIIALAVTRFVRNSNRIWKKIAVVILLAVIVISAGNLAYKRDTFCLAENWYKLPNDVAETCDIMLSRNEEVRCIMPASLYSYVRQYSGDIKQLYGRNAEGFITNITGIDRKIAIYMNLDIPPYDDILCYAEFNGYNYVVTGVGKSIPDDVTEYYGYTLLATTGAYNIYYHSPDNQKDEWLVTQYGSETKWYNTMYTVESQSGRLIIIDGGGSSNMDALTEVIDAHDGYVDAWILTTYRKDHIEAFFDIVQDKNVTIGNIYTSEADFNALQSSTKNEEQVEFYVKCEEELSGLEQVHYLKAGDSFQVEDLSFNVLNAWNVAADDDKKNMAYNASLAFSVSGNNNSILFCSDVTEKQEEIMLKAIGDKSYDYIQLSNHGDGLSSEFYTGINARAVFLDTCISKISSEAVQSRVKELTDTLVQKGIKVYSFTSRPNMVLIR